MPRAWISNAATTRSRFSNDIGGCSPNPMRQLGNCLAIFALVAQSGLAASTQVPGRDEVYIIPFSHLDLFWAGTQEECLSRGNRITSKAVQIALQHPEFRFLLEDDVFVEHYRQTRLGTKELEDFKR